MDTDHTVATARPRSPRIVLRVADPEKFRNHYLPDLSSGMVFIKSEKLLPIGADVEVELHPPGWDRPLLLGGRVARRIEIGGASPAGMRVSFEELDPTVSRRLDDLLEEFSPTAAPATVPGEASSTTPPSRAVENQKKNVREMAELRGRLAAAEATIAELRAELAVHEEDEAGTRALAERLALQKNRLERARRKEGEEAAVEIERLRRSLAESHNARSELEQRAAESVAQMEKLALRTEGAERTARGAEERITALEGRRKELEVELAAEKDARAELEHQVAALTLELESSGEARRKEERKGEAIAIKLAEEEGAHRATRTRVDDLTRRLDDARQSHAAERDRLLAELSALSARTDESVTASARTEERLGEATARIEDLESRLSLSEDRLRTLRARAKDLRRLLQVVSAKAAEGPDIEPEEPGAPPVSIEDTLAGRSPGIDAGGVIVAADLLAGLGGARGFSAPDGELQLDVDMEEEESPFGGVPFTEFVERIRHGTRVRRSEAFRSYQAIEPSELRLVGWLARADSLPALRELAGTKIAEERLERLLFDFYRRGLLELA